MLLRTNSTIHNDDDDNDDDDNNDDYDDDYDNLIKVIILIRPVMVHAHSMSAVERTDALIYHVVTNYQRG